MSETQCNHAIWLERIVPQLTESPHWLLHDARDGDPPGQDISEDLVFDYCPLCGTKLRAD